MLTVGTDILPTDLLCVSISMAERVFHHAGKNPFHPSNATLQSTTVSKRAAGKRRRGREA